MIQFPWTFVGGIKNIGIYREFLFQPNPIAYEFRHKWLLISNQGVHSAITWCPTVSECLAWSEKTKK